MAANLKLPFLEQGKAPICPTAARLRSTAFPRTTYILAFIGVVFICLTLLKIPKVEGGLPLPLNHEILISFAVGSVFGILLNLFVFLMHLLAFMNERKLNKTQPPLSHELMEMCFQTQKKLIRAIQVTEAFIFIFGSSFWVYVLVVGVFGTFLPYKDADSFTGISANLYQSAAFLLILLKFLMDGFPKHWGLDSDL